MATTPGLPAEPARAQRVEGSTNARASDQSADREGTEATIALLKRQVIALQRVSSLGVVAGGIFHELNNALTPIVAYAKLGLRNPDPAYRERALKQILESAERAATISRGMLGLARVGTARTEHQPADLAQLVEEVALLVSKDLSKHRVRLELKLAGRRELASSRRRSSRCSSTFWSMPGRQCLPEAWSACASPPIPPAGSLRSA